jgi:hypothetical protein
MQAQASLFQDNLRTPPTSPFVSYLMGHLYDGTCTRSTHAQASLCPSLSADLWKQGFVRMALMHGAPLVPAFCFGQAGTYSWIRPGPPLFSDAAVSWVASKLGFLPVYVYGYWFLPMPMRVRPGPIAVVRSFTMSLALVKPHAPRILCKSCDFLHALTYMRLSWVSIISSCMHSQVPPNVHWLK